MPSFTKVSYNLDILENINRELKKIRVVKIGIMGDSNARGDESGLTNAEVGARHEFGVISEGLSRRSFLKDPLVLKKDVLEKDVAASVKRNIASNPGRIFEDAGISGEAIIQRAFESGGYGMWKPLSPVTIEKKGSSTILVDLAYLRGSITSKVEDK